MADALKERICMRKGKPTPSGKMDKGFEVKEKNFDFFYVGITVGPRRIMARN